ncbi:hypothetical protein Avbf_16633 [Armadillidium vulgare]|nr:hypothetical protein Avbf_16633 [Armadillidium vulgare]
MLILSLLSILPSEAFASADPDARRARNQFWYGENSFEAYFRRYRRRRRNQLKKYQRRQRHRKYKE